MVRLAHTTIWAIFTVVILCAAVLALSRAMHYEQCIHQTTQLEDGSQYNSCTGETKGVPW